MVAQSKTHPNFDHEMKPILSLLSDTTSQQLTVPDYQRSYSWGRNDYEAFWKDLTDFAWKHETNAQTYFLGAIILVQHDRLEILDGQQRIATTTILLSSMAEFFQQVDNVRLNDRIITRHIRDEDVNGKGTYLLKLNRYDATFFRNHVQQYRQATAKIESHRNIKDCKKFFDGMFRDLITKNGKEDAEELAIKLYEAIRRSVYVLSLTAYNFDDAADVFEKLNDRGIQLSTVDLVRMLLIGQCQRKEIEDVIDMWQDILTLEPPANASDLLRYYWITLEGDPTSSRLYRVIKPKISGRNVKHEAGKTYRAFDFTEGLTRAAEIYREIIAAKEDDKADDYTRVAAHVVDLNAKPLIPLLIKINSFDSGRDRIALTAWRMFVRNRLIGGLSSTDFENLIYRVTKEISEDTVEFYINELKHNIRSDANFEDDFAHVEINVQKRARYLLKEIETHLQASDELAVKSSMNVHIEHIYPKNPENKHRWQAHDEWIHRLGNQTLLSGSRNRKAQNKLFPDKKHLYKESRLILNEWFSTSTSWSKNDIEKRQRKLAKIAVKVWPIDFL